MVGAKDILIKLKGDNDDFEQKMDESDNSVKKLGKTLGGVLVAGAIAAAGAILILMKNSVDLTKELGHLNLKLGISVENLSAMKYADGKIGVEFEDLTEAIKDMTIRQGEAAEGDENAIRMFNRLGISIRDSNGKLKDAETLYYEVAKALSEIEDQSVRTALGTELMGDNYYKVAPAIMEINNVITDVDYAKIHGLAITSEEVEQIQAFRGEMSKLEFLTEKFGVSLAKEVLPHLSTFNNEIDNFAENDGIPRAVNLILGAVEALYGFFKIIKNLIDVIYKGFIMTAGVFTDLIGLTDDLTGKMSVSISGDLEDMTSGANIWNAGGSAMAYGVTGEGGYLESARQLRNANEINESTDALNKQIDAINKNTDATNAQTNAYTKSEGMEQVINRKTAGKSDMSAGTAMSLGYDLDRANINTNITGGETVMRKNPKYTSNVSGVP